MIYLIRHGQTEWNKRQTFRGQKDIPLSNEGKKQAYYTGKFFSDNDIVIKKIFTSPLKRSKETAQQISDATKASLFFIDGLTDINFGQWEGKNYKWVMANDPSTYYLYKNYPEKVAFPGGESLNECLERAYHTFFSIAKENNFSFAVVTHRVILKLIIIGLLGLSTNSFWQFQLDTCSISEVDYLDGRFILRSLNNSCHLQNALKLTIDF